MEWYAFVHFSLNTYTDREWGYGNESPQLFNPVRFNADTIVHTFREAGMSGMIYTAKHHDGWCSWPTLTTKHNITASPWKNGGGDVVKEFSEACENAGIAFGVYLSPWDRYCPDYGHPEYLKIYYEQVEELLTQYGPIFEIWFDGANGGDGYYGGACENRNIGEAVVYYDYARLVEKIRGLQPNCIIWGACELGDVEWGGSEKGHVPYPNRNVRVVNGKEKWLPLEGDTPINGRGWFWHPGQASAVKSPELLMQVYLDSVGRGANLVLNVAPNRDGELDSADVASLLEFGRMRRELLSRDYALGAVATASEVRGSDSRFDAAKLTDGDIESYWCPEDSTTTASMEITLREPTLFDVIRIREQIRLGQRVESFEIDARINGTWQTIDSEGKSIGHQVMRRLKTPVTADALRIRITSAHACPCISEVSLLRMPMTGFNATEAKSNLGLDRRGWISLSSAVLDGNHATLWQQKAERDSIMVDMQQEQTLTAFSYLPRQDGETTGIVDRYRFETSMDGRNWQLVDEGEFSNMRANPIEQRINFAPVKARYWRFTPLRTLDGDAATIAEINLFSAP